MLTFSIVGWVLQGILTQAFVVSSLEARLAFGTSRVDLCGTAAYALSSEASKFKTLWFPLESLWSIAGGLAGL